MIFLQRPSLRLLLALSLAGAVAASAVPASAKTTPARKAAAAKKKAAPKVDYAGQAIDFRGWPGVAEFEQEMMDKHGFDREALAAVMAQVHFVDAAVQLVKPAPPGKPKNWQAYSALFIEPVRIEAGVKFWNENAETLARAETEYGVPAAIIAGIIGVETVYGRNTGRFRVMDVLTTLAFAYPDTPNRQARMEFFRGELANTLLLARKENIDPFSLLGSFAGAVGLPQFMPGSILAYAVDYDGDGHIDLRNSPADAIGSVASFLVQHGWKRAQQGPLVYPARVTPSGDWETMINHGLTASYSIDAMAAAGVDTDAVVPADGSYGLVDLQNGLDATEYWLATDNFFAITQYNRSFFYAMSVIELGRAVRVARGD